MAYSKHLLRLSNVVVHHCQTELLLAGGAGALGIHRLTSLCPIQTAGYFTVPVSFRFSAGVSSLAQGIGARQQDG